MPQRIYLSPFSNNPLKQRKLREQAIELDFGITGMAGLVRLDTQCSGVKLGKIVARVIA